MPPLLCVSPVILDQSFPRSANELSAVAIALGELQQIAATDAAHIVLTPSMANFIDFFEWGSPPRPYDILTEIHRLMVQWLLQPHERIIWIKCAANAKDYPVPCTNPQGELLEFWSKEVEELAVAHKASRGARRSFIGIACPYLFLEAAEPHQCGYGEQDAEFPLVGPTSFLNMLDDAYEWVLPHDLHQKLVSFRAARDNIGAIGGTIRGSTASHFEVTFRNGRTWPLDINTDPLPDRFIDELGPITGLPRNVVKFCLLEGRLPPARLRITI